MLVEQLPDTSRMAAVQTGWTQGWGTDRLMMRAVISTLAAANWQRGGKSSAPRPKPWPLPGEREAVLAARRAQYEAIARGEAPPQLTT